MGTEVLKLDFDGLVEQLKKLERDKELARKRILAGLFLTVGTAGAAALLALPLVAWQFFSKRSEYQKAKMKLEAISETLEKNYRDKFKLYKAREYPQFQDDRDDAIRLIAFLDSLTPEVREKIGSIEFESEKGFDAGVDVALTELLEGVKVGGRYQRKNQKRLKIDFSAR